MAATNRIKPKGLRGSSFSVSLASNPFPLVFRTCDRCQGCGGSLRHPRRFFGVLASLSIRNQAPTYLARRDLYLCERILLPDEYGEGAAADDNNHSGRHPPSFSAKIRLAFAIDVRLRVDL